MEDRLASYLIDNYTNAAREANMIRELLLERNQLYGALIFCMRQFTNGSFEINKDEFGTDSVHQVVFTPNGETGSLLVTLKELKENVTI